MSDYESLKRVAEELRTFAMEHKVEIITARQLPPRRRLYPIEHAEGPIFIDYNGLLKP